MRYRLVIERVMWVSAEKKEGTVGRIVIESTRQIDKRRDTHEHRERDI